MGNHSHHVHSSVKFFLFLCSYKELFRKDVESSCVVVVYVYRTIAKPCKRKKRKERKENLGARLGCLAKGLKGVYIGLPTLYSFSFLRFTTHWYLPFYT